jgi:hypothetical protein
MVEALKLILSHLRGEIELEQRLPKARAPKAAVNKSSPFGAELRHGRIRARASRRRDSCSARTFSPSEVSGLCCGIIGSTSGVNVISGNRKLRGDFRH